MQAKNAREIPIEERIESIYLQEILLEKNKVVIEENILADISTVSSKHSSICRICSIFSYFVIFLCI